MQKILLVALLTSLGIGIAEIMVFSAYGPELANVEKYVCFNGVCRVSR